MRWRAWPSCELRCRSLCSVAAPVDDWKLHAVLAGLSEAYHCSQALGFASMSRTALPGTKRLCFATGPVFCASGLRKHVRAFEQGRRHGRAVKLNAPGEQTRVYCRCGPPSCRCARMRPHGRKSCANQAKGFRLIVHCGTLVPCSKMQQRVPVSSLVQILWPFDGSTARKQLRGGVPGALCLACAALAAARGVPRPAGAFPLLQ